MPARRKTKGRAEAYQAGAMAFEAGRDRATNPHPPGSAHWKAWDAGYSAAQASGEIAAQRMEGGS